MTDVGLGELIAMMSRAVESTIEIEGRGVRLRVSEAVVEVPVAMREVDERGRGNEQGRGGRVRAALPGPRGDREAGRGRMGRVRLTLADVADVQQLPDEEEHPK